MASKDLSKGKMDPKAKTNASSSSFVPPRKYGAHSGLKFKFNKDTIGVESRTDKKLSTRKLDDQSEKKRSLQFVSNAITNSKLESEKKTEMLSTRKLDAQSDKQRSLQFVSNAITNSKLESEKTEKPLTPEDEEQFMLKIKLERDSRKNAAAFESKIKREKLPPTEDGENPGLKMNLERDSKKKSASLQSKIGKEKPPRKYGAHSGLKFKFNVEKNVIPKTFIFGNLTEDVKGGPTAVITAKPQIFENQIRKDVKSASGGKTSASNLEEKVKTLRVSDSTFSAVPKKNVQVDDETSSDEDNSNLCRDSVKYLRDLKHQPQNSKIMNSQACNILKPQEITPKASNLSRVDVRQISKSRSLVTKESSIPRYSDAKRVGSITMQTFENQTHNEERHNAGMKIYESTSEADEEENEFFYEVIVDENVPDDFEILSKKETAKLCSNPAASFLDLKIQQKSSKITNSRACYKWKRPETASKSTKSSSLNVHNISNVGPPVTKELPFPFQGYSEDESVGTITVQVVENQTHTEKYHNSGMKKHESTLDEDGEEKDFYEVIVDENVRADFKIFRKKETAKLRRNPVASSVDLKHQYKSPKLTNSRACNTLKQPEISSKSSNSSSLNLLQFSNVRPPVTKESLMPGYSDTERVGTITKQVVENQTQKERHNSGTGKPLSTLKDDLKSAGQFGHNSISMKNEQEDAKISIDNESEDLCSRVAASLRVLQPQLKTLNISKSQASDTSKPQAATPKTSKLPIWNVEQNSKGQPVKLDETVIPVRPKKYGFHAGLRFHFKEKKATPEDVTFNRTSSSSLPKDKCFKNEKRDPAS